MLNQIVLNLKALLSPLRTQPKRYKAHKQQMEQYFADHPDEYEVAA